MFRFILSALLVLTTATALAQPTAFELLPRTNENLVGAYGRNKVVHHHESEAGSVTVFHLRSAVQVGDRYLQPQVGRMATLIVHQDLQGTVQRIDRFQLDGVDVKAQARLLAGGDLLLAGSTEMLYREQGGARVLVARLDAEGRSRWRSTGALEPLASCDARETLCGFVDIEHLMTEGGHAWISGSARTGRLSLGDTALRMRSYLGHFLVRIDLSTGQVGWVRTGAATALRRGALYTIQSDRLGRLTAVQRALRSGRITDRVRLAGRGHPERSVVHDGGYAAVVESAVRGNDCMFVGWNLRGRERFRFPVACQSKIVARPAGYALAETTPFHGFDPERSRLRASRGIRLSLVTLDGVRHPVAEHRTTFLESVRLLENGFLAGVIGQGGKMYLAIRRANMPQPEDRFDVPTAPPRSVSRGPVHGF